ncbi:DUF1524 domain-containing protein [Rhodococcus sp. BL-253-APC-6A1W]|uniref:GmrSD restriction endonuclease domain-containing protein n=1 Tax=Rhodococcus sp. BL-253-APC-6A1W TaxID=2725307 RepID=UPI00146A1182|nr:DUF1524 domain-containing protein [Rhodococcus sp. BL-253-APC-6A1W]NMD97258.1 DUF1524 domain-containing protein [Rhodococcus sp. BL-253-APC-6A1W]
MASPRTSSGFRALVAATVAGFVLVGCGGVEEDTASAVPAVAATDRSTTERVAPAPTTPPAPTAPSTAPPAVSEDTSSMSAALSRLTEIPIKGRAPKTGYDRDLFGQAWSDDVSVEFGHNGCDTRNDILRRDLVDIAYKPGTRDCVVASGTLHDVYTGTTIAFTRGQDTSTAVQIDHVVALSDAWQKGAQQLDPETRANFANDPRNLQAVDGPTNSRKGDGDAATWLPPHRPYRCTYVARQVQVKAEYGLWVTQAEHDAMVRILTECGGTATGVAAGSAGTDTATPVPTTVAPQPQLQPQPLAPAPAPAPEPAPASAYYKNCSAARAAGAAPLYAGEPGYRAEMDRDKDGVACE